MKPTVALALCATAALLATGAHAAYCHGGPSPTAQPNPNPINTAAPKLVRTVKNGKLFQAGTGNDTFWVVHVYGTPYEMGYAQGQLLREELQQFFEEVWAYIESQVEEVVKFLPDWLAKMVAEAGMDVALDLTHDLTGKYSGQHIWDEMQGMADATGVWVKRIVRVHMIGELTKADCSMFGAWGEATAQVGGGVLQLRALDWDVDGPFRDHPAVVVYHPNEGNGHPFANVGFVGWVGTVTGMSSRQMAISEIGVSFPDSTFGQESREGVNFVFLLRDILQFDSSLTESLQRISNSKRTCNLILGVGDGATDKSFRAIQYSHSVANVQADDNMMPLNDTWHPRLRNVVYYGMDWLCPGYSQVLHQQLNKFYGSITAEVAVRDIVPVVQTGNLHIAVYDLTHSTMHVGFARRSTVTEGPKMAFDRVFTRLDMAALFAEPAPASSWLRGWF